MCGRFVMVSDLDNVVDAFQVSRVESSMKGSYNIAPGSDVAVIAGNSDGGRTLRDMAWGLPLPGREGGSAGRLLINARSETVDRKPTFSEAFRRRRCVVVANGYYEWERRKEGRVPWYVRLLSAEIMGMAAVYSVSAATNGVPIPACAIITTEANDLTRPIHHRMPVILGGDDIHTWLGEGSDEAALKNLLRPRPSRDMTAWEVSRAVNSPRHNGPSCIEPVIEPFPARK